MSTAHATAVSACAALCIASAAAAQPETARYRLTFDSPWSPQTHPGAYPFDAHYSPPVGTVHSDAVEFWAPGGIASFGMEIMAESGSTGPLRGQISNAIDDGTAINFILGGRLDSPGAHPDLEFDATRAHDRLTLVTMIAPSPDWFLGIHGLPLRDNNGDWITSMTVGLDAYDAGTDSGPGFTSANADLTPHAPITNIQNDAPFAGLPQLASFTITLIDVMPCPADINRDGLADGSDFFAWVAAFGNGDPIADTNEDGTVSGSDFFSWVAAFGIGCE